jgi:hypothetical protein
MAGQVVAVEPFAVELDGKDLIVHEGDVFDAKHPAVKGREHLFTKREAHGVNETPAVKRRRRSPKAGKAK